MTLFLLSLIVFVCFTVQAMLGFGASVLAVTAAVHLVPLERLIPMVLGPNLMISVYILGRYHQQIDRGVLLRNLLPFVGAGLPLGMLAFGIAGGFLKLGFGCFVVLIAGFELARLLRSPAGTIQPPLPAWQAAAILLCAGFAHGMYASGGPLVVYFASRQLPDKRRFRATLSLMWLLMDILILGGSALRGVIDRQVLLWIAVLCLPMVLGIVVGEWLHGRVKEHQFRMLVFILLLGGGMVLVISTL